MAQGRAAEAILDTADQIRAAAIAMATHGRSGVQRWVMGSMTERVLGATRLPLLIVRPKVVKVQPEKAQEEEAAASWVGLL